MWRVQESLAECKFHLLDVLNMLQLIRYIFMMGEECTNPLDENEHALKRPKGYSCEELGGAMIGLDKEFPQMERLSLLEPFFISPWEQGAVDMLKH